MQTLNVTFKLNGEINVAKSEESLAENRLVNKMESEWRFYKKTLLNITLLGPVGFSVQTNFSQNKPIEGEPRAPHLTLSQVENDSPELLS